MKRSQTPQIVVVTFFIVCIVFFGYLIINEIAKINKMNREISLKYEEIAALRSSVNKLREMEKNAGDMEARLQAIREMLPEEPSEDGVLEYLQNLAKSAPAVLEQVRFEDRVPAGGFVEMPLSLTFNSSYKGFLNLMTGVMYGDRLFRVDEVRIENKTGNGLSIDVKASTFCTQ